MKQQRRQQYRFHTQSVIDMLDVFFQSLSPFDIVMAKYFKNNKWIGSHERREIAELSYSIFRNYEAIKFYTKNITGNFGRFFMLVFLKIVKKFSNEKISEIFSGRLRDPQKLTEFEKKFLTSIDEQASFPDYVILNYPEWMEPYLQRAFEGNINNLRDEMTAMNKKAFVDLRINTLKSTKDDVKKMLTESGFLVEDTKYAKNGIRILNGRIGRNHEVIVNGLAEIQDEGSQLVAEVCNATSDDVVVDFCAGAGGKTLAIASSMSNKGKIFALDKFPERLENAKIRLRRANVNNVFCQEITGKWMKRHRECADIVLVDVPCSGTGTWRRNPDMRAKFSQQDLEELLAVQSEILEMAKTLVKKGGRLIYATCSILIEENEDQIAKFVEKSPEFAVKKIGFDGTDYMKLSPYKNGTDGFFAACLQNLKKC